MESFITIGKRIYRTEVLREARRLVIFVGRCMFNRNRMKQLDAYFHKNEELQAFIKEYPYAYEQPTRAFFYNQSTFNERAALLEQHLDFLQGTFRSAVFLKFYRHEDQVIWEDEHEGEPLRLALYFEPGQRKEGLLSVVLRLGNQRPLYQMIFWIAKNKAGEWSLWIGAMQGPNMENAKDVIKKITKQCHAYRTKNLIFHATQEVARAMGLQHIYAVTNHGYYANNHVRRDRKLKTDFSKFWSESGGMPCEDERFYEMPLVEHRKTMEEVPTRKRAVYRRRFALLDEIDASIAEHVKKMMKGQD